MCEAGFERNLSETGTPDFASEGAFGNHFFERPAEFLDCGSTGGHVAGDVFVKEVGVGVVGEPGFIEVIATEFAQVFAGGRFEDDLSVPGLEASVLGDPSGVALLTEYGIVP